MTLLDNMYRDGTLISAGTFLDDLRKLNYNTSRVKDYFDALQSTRYRETFPVSGTYQKVFNLLKGTYNPGTSSVEVYIDGSKINSFEETSSNKITTTDNVQAGSVVDIYYKNIPSYSPDEINQLMDDYSNFKVAASEFNSTLQSVKDTWLSDTSVMISTKINDQLKAPLTELGNQIESAKTESSQALEDLNNNIDSMRSTYNSTNNDMTTKFNALKDTLSKLDTDTTTIKSRIDEINKSLDKVDINMITSSILELESYQLLVPSDKDGDFTGKSDVTKFTILTKDKMTYTISAKISGDDSSKSSVVLYDKSDPSKISQQGSVPNSDSISSLTFVGDGSTLTVGVHSSGSQVSFSDMTGTKTDTYVPYRVAITNSQYVPLINNGVLYYNLANGMTVSSDLKDVAHTHSDSLLSLSTPVSSTTTSGDYLITSAQLATISEVPSSECANPGILQVRSSGSYIYQTLITSINTRSRLSIDKSSSWSQWRTVADDSKLVHISDMRKPASDVAGIEETVLDNHDNTITANGASYDLSKSGLTTLQVVSSGSFNNLPLGTAFANGTVMTDGPDNIHCFTTTTFYSSLYSGRKAQIAIADSTNLMFFRTFVAPSWNSWTKLADDSKVAHLSGTNNFDTVPTVKNNPLLLASSLPSDLARTGQDENFTGNITFDNTPKMKNGDPLVTASQTGDVSKLLTRDKSNYVNSINELASIVDRFYPVASQAIPTDNISYANQNLVYNYDPSKNTVTFRKNDSSYSINYNTSVVGTNFTENSGGAAPLGGIRIYFKFKAIHYVNKTEGTLSDINYYVWNPNDSSTVKSGELGLLKGIPYYLTSENFEVGSNYTIDFSGNGMDLSTSGNNRISPKLIISNKGNGVLNITPYHGEDFKDDKSEGYWIYPYITKMISYSVDTTAMKALPDGYSYDYVKDTNPSSTGNYLTAWGQGSYQYKFDLNNLGNGYSIDSMGSSITIKVSIKGNSSTGSSPIFDGYTSSQFPSNTFTTNKGTSSGSAVGSLGRSYIRLVWKLSKEDILASSYTAYYQAVSNGSTLSIFYAIKLVINNDNTISIYAIAPFVCRGTTNYDPSKHLNLGDSFSSITTMSIVNNV